MRSSRRMRHRTVLSQQLVDAIASAVEVAEQSRAPELKQAVDSGSLLVAAGYSRAIPAPPTAPLP